MARRAPREQDGWMSGRVGEGRQAAEEGRWTVTSDRAGILLRIYTTIPTSRSSLPGLSIPSGALSILLCCDCEVSLANRYIKHWFWSLPSGSVLGFCGTFEVWTA